MQLLPLGLEIADGNVIALQRIYHPGASCALYHGENHCHRGSWDSFNDDCALKYLENSICCRRSVKWKRVDKAMSRRFESGVLMAASNTVGRRAFPYTNCRCLWINDMRSKRSLRMIHNQLYRHRHASIPLEVMFM